MKRLMKTTRSIKPTEVEKKWILIDANGLVLGRAAVVIADILRGKRKVTYTPHVDCGDNVIVINADRVCFTGRKLDQKVYHRHSGYAGGLKTVRARDMLEGRFPERVLEKAVERMIPRGPLGRQQMRNLRIFAGPEHPHEAQNPEFLDVAALNRKNAISEYISPVPTPSNRYDHYISRHDERDDKPSSRRSGPRPAVTPSPWSLQEVERLKDYLDRRDPEVRHEALNKLAALLPIPASDEAVLDRAGVVALRSLAMRLLRALLENAYSADAARDAAIALVKTVFPQNYRDRGHDAKAQEQQAYGDLRQIIDHHELHYFCTLNTERGPHGAATIEAFLWSCFPFDLAGRTPCLNAAEWVNVGEGLSMRIDGATLVEDEPIDKGALYPGQILGCQGHLRALSRPDSEVVVHLYNGPRLIYEQVYPHDFIFKSHDGVARG